MTLITDIKLTARIVPIATRGGIPNIKKKNNLTGPRGIPTKPPI